MKSPIRLVGAKHKESGLLPSLLPAAKCWVEPFIGAGHVLLGAIDQGRWQNYLIGELDPVAANFWEQVAAGHSKAIASVAQPWVSKAQALRHQGHPDQLTLFDLGTALTFPEFRDSLWEWFHRVEGDDSVEAAAAWAVLNRSTFNGGGRHAGVSRDAVTQKLTPGFLSRLAALALPRTTVHRGDYRETLARAPKDAAVFLDPPYFTATPVYQDHAKFDFEALAETCRGLTQPWVMTIDDCPEVRALFAGLPMQQWSKDYSATKERKVGRELLIANFEFQATGMEVA